MALAGSLTLTLTIGSLWLLLGYTQGLGNTEQARANLDAIRTALSIAIGSGGAFALWLATRRQRSAELQLKETSRIADENRAHQERIAESNDFDTRERRITDLYVKAVEQLGSDKAPVRLGGLYALERLATGNRDHGQTAVNIVCAYLRMPYHLPEDTAANLYKSAPIEGLKDRSREDLQPYEELQVRLTAQRILGNLLRYEDPHPRDKRTCPEVYDIDLRGAILIGLEFSECHMGRADFGHARFVSTPHFNATIFHDDAWFYEATFDMVADFNFSTFLGGAIFTRCLFPGTLSMRSARISDDAYFEGSQFGSEANFSEVAFYYNVNFGDCILATDKYEESDMERGGWPSPGFEFSGATAKTGAQLVWPTGWETRATSIEGVEEVVRTAPPKATSPAATSSDQHAVDGKDR